MLVSTKIMIIYRLAIKIARFNGHTVFFIAWDSFAMNFSQKNLNHVE